MQLVLTPLILQLMEKPDVDSIEGLSPAISIEQKTTSRNPRSTVGTVTEIHDYLRLLFARAGQAHCPQCGRPVSRQTPEQIVEPLLLSIGQPALQRAVVAHHQQDVLLSRHTREPFAHRVAGPQQVRVVVEKFNRS